MPQSFYVRRDTASWVFQVWLAFVVAVLACAIGIWELPSNGLDRPYLATGFFFCLSSAFALAKSIRDNQNEQVDTPAWRLQVWAAFIIAATLTGWGFFRASPEVAFWQKAYLVASWLFLISSTFTLAKTIRDKHDADLLENASGLETPTQRHD